MQSLSPYRPRSTGFIYSSCLSVLEVMLFQELGESSTDFIDGRPRAKHSSMSCQWSQLLIQCIVRSPISPRTYRRTRSSQVGNPRSGRGDICEEVPLDSESRSNGTHAVCSGTQRCGTLPLD